METGEVAVEIYLEAPDDKVENYNLQTVEDREQATRKSVCSDLKGHYCWRNGPRTCAVRVGAILSRLLSIAVWWLRSCRGPGRVHCPDKCKFILRLIQLALAFSREFFATAMAPSFTMFTWLIWLVGRELTLGTQSVLVFYCEFTAAVPCPCAADMQGNESCLLPRICYFPLR